MRQLQPVQIIQLRVFHPKKKCVQLKLAVWSKSIWLSLVSSLFPVHTTGPLNTSHSCRIFKIYPSTELIKTKTQTQNTQVLCKKEANQINSIQIPISERRAIYQHHNHSTKHKSKTELLVSKWGEERKQFSGYFTKCPVLKYIFASYKYSTNSTKFS